MRSHPPSGGSLIHAGVCLLCRCIWIDYKGAEVVYSVLTPGQSALYKTWVGHFWIVRRTDDMTRACFQSDCQNALQEICVGKEDKQTLQIVDAPQASAARWVDPAHAQMPQQSRIAIPQRRLRRLQMPPYSERTHHMFPESFKREVQQLLLCYHRAQAVSEVSVRAVCEGGLQAAALTRRGLRFPDKLRLSFSMCSTPLPICRPFAGPGGSGARHAGRRPPRHPQAQRHQQQPLLFCHV